MKLFPTMDCEDPAVLRDLAAQKEKEWKDISEKRLQALETAVKEKEQELSQLSVKFNKLKEDFKYNLKLLEERDLELQRYDSTFAELKAEVNVRNAELSEAQIKVDDAKRALEREQQARDELHSSYQHRLREKEAEIETFKNAKNGELYQERNEFESLRRTLQRQLTEVQADLEKQRLELTVDFEDALKKREHEFRTQMDEMNAKVMEYDLKAKLLSKELELSRQDQDRRSLEAEEASDGQRQLEKRLKQAQWKVADVTAVKDASIKDLTEKLRQQEKAAAHLQEDFQRKYAEMDRSMRDHQASLDKVRAACSQKEEAAAQEMQQLQSKLEDANIRIRQLQWTNSDLTKDHQILVQKLQEEIQQLKGQWDTNLKEMSHDAVTRDVELGAAREEIARLKSDLAQRKEDMNRYRKELQQATEREKVLEQSKTQAELDWQRRCEDLERRQYGNSEDLIASLTQARDKAFAESKEKGREIEQCRMMLRAVGRDRDAALATLHKHQIPLDKDIQVLSEGLGQQEADKLREQNQNLRAALASMKEMMESMGHSMPPDIQQHSLQDNEYVSSLEEEVKQLKRENRDLKEKVATAERFGRLAVQPPGDSQPILAEVKDSNIRSHILSLNHMLGALRGEKVELSAALKKQQARIQHLEQALEEASKQPRELQVTLEQLRYENGAQQRRHGAESAAQRQRITLLESQLAESQREADMFHQASVENNSQLTALRDQVSNLKLELSEKRPAINFGAQELVIQQLQEELKSLRCPSGPEAGGVRGGGMGDSAPQLRVKLRQAAGHIAQLVRDKQQLLELSNKLRAELKTGDVRPSARPSQSVKHDRNQQGPVRSPERDVAGRLSQLEQLQYQLTRQELQYAQRFAPPPAKTSHTPDRTQARLNAAQAGQSAVHLSQATTDSSLRASSTLPASQLLSSVNSQDIVDVLRMVEGPHSPDIHLCLSANHNGQPSHDHQKLSDDPVKDGGTILVSGQQVKVDHKGQQHAATRPLSTKATGRVQKGKPAQRPRVRNYNYKNDDNRR